MDLIAFWIRDQAVGIALGITVSLLFAIMRRIWKWVRRKRLVPKIEEAYHYVQMVCEPASLEPAHPGDLEYMKSRARDHANPLTNRLKKAGFFPPPQCTTEDQSLNDWFRFLGNVRTEIG